MVIFSVLVAAITVCVSTSSDQDSGLENTNQIDFLVTDEQSIDRTNSNHVAFAEILDSEDNPEPTETDEEKSYRAAKPGCTKSLSQRDGSTGTEESGKLLGVILERFAKFGH